MIVAAILLSIAGAFPSPAKTDWMSPEAFHLAIGMPRSKVVDQLGSSGWKPHPGKAPNHIVVEVDQAKTLTLEFDNDLLRSARFELFDFFPDVKAAFREQSAALRKRFGVPKRGVPSKSVLIYDKVHPNIIVVISTDPHTSAGRQGLGFLTVRYFEPTPAE
jgi:hypothetical protein